jgi:hypothetical protein
MGLEQRTMYTRPRRLASLYRSRFGRQAEITKCPGDGARPIHSAWSLPCIGLQPVRV